MEQLPLRIKLSDTARFRTYWSGPNAGVVDYLEKLTGQGRDPGAWLWGARAVGKSHLLQAACDAADRAGLRSGYLPLATLMDHGPDLFDGWGAVDLLALDDVDALAGRDDYERGLFRLYNELAEHGGRLIVASTRAPSGLELHLADLASRLGALVVFHVEPLDDAGMVEALSLRARGRGLELPDETARFLMRRLPRDMASLCDWLDRFDLASLKAKRRLTVPFVRQILNDPT